MGLVLDRTEYQTIPSEKDHKITMEYDMWVLALSVLSNGLIAFNRLIEGMEKEDNEAMAPSSRMRNAANIRTHINTLRRLAHPSNRHKNDINGTLLIHRFVVYEQRST
jgi:hypothetical protein